MKNTQGSAASQAVTLESLSQTLMKHTTAQLEKDEELRASIKIMESRSQTRIDQMESNSKEMFAELKAQIDSTFEKMIGLMAKRDSKSPEVTEIPPPPYRHPNHQVYVSNSEPGRSVRSEESGDRNSVVASRERLLKRIELPVFAGDDAYGWMALAERYFRIGGFDERMKLDVVSVSLGGDVLSWFNSEMHRSPFLSWINFKERMIARFSREKLRDPSQPFFAVKQTGSVAQYIHMFEDLSTQVTGLTEGQREGIFMNGLNPEMREVVNMSKPVDLPEMIATAYQMEDSVLYKMVCREKQQEAKGSYKSGYVKPSSSQYAGTSSQSKQNHQQNTAVQNVGSVNKTQRPQVRLTDQQIAEKKRLGLCFTCDEKWSRQHWCPNKSLQVLTVVNGIEMEIVDQSLIEIEEDEKCEGTSSSLMALSLNSFLGISSPTTTKVRGNINRNTVVVMIDSGATHNFISPSAVEKNKLRVTHNANLEVLLGTGISVQGIGVCKDVNIILPTMSFEADFIVLELGNADIILGVQWLRTLGSCMVDWERNVWSFMYKGQPVTLIGDPTLHGQKVSLKTLTPERRVNRGGMEIECKKGETLGENAEVIPLIVAETLQQFEAVFQKPKGLPPVRGREHSIILQDNTKPINQRETVSLSTCTQRDYAEFSAGNAG